MSSRISIAFKYMRQLGLRPLALYGLYKFGLRTGHYRRMESSKPKEVPLSSAIFPLPSREQLASVLGEAGQAALIKAADEIVSGKVRIFGARISLDFNLKQPLQHWTAYENNSKLLSAITLPHNDIKFLWEPARFGWAFTLGRAYHLTQDKKYAEAFWKYFESFTQHNPAYMGPHWMNGQEVALRMLALLWAAHVFETTSALSTARREQLIQNIYLHAARIPPTLVYARSQNNNHLVTEATAIYTAGLFYKNSKWRALGWKWLNWSFQHQIGGFGEYIQHSTNYHRLMLQTALWIYFIKEDVFPTNTIQALARSAHWLFSLLDNASGRTPNLGANDGALIFPLSISAFDDYRPTIQAAARAFLRMTLPSGAWDELSLWFGLKATAHETDASAYLTDNLRARYSWAYLRASNFKSRLSHMDQLHVDLWWRGINIAQDAGTYLYNAEVPWDNPLVTANVHNTVTVDGHDQMTRAGKFLVLGWAGAFSKQIIESDERVLHKLRAYFTGYRKMGVTHERTISVYADEFWEIQDRLLNRRRRSHLYRLHWLLVDGEWELENDEHTVTLHITTEAGGIKLIVHHPTNMPSRYSLVRAGELLKGERDVKPYEGWVSRNYGEKQPALSFVLEVKSPYHTTLVSEFTFSGK